ncbi:hypothetical protein D6779_07535 [Candidatus Parcubacteria bacterium]|nr:MAG: hypothetical protein D6779_07535 [Candidatus Parcubacteria bacterium]
MKKIYLSKRIRAMSYAARIVAVVLGVVILAGSSLFVAFEYHLAALRKKVRSTEQEIAILKAENNKLTAQLLEIFNPQKAAELAKKFDLVEERNPHYFKLSYQQLWRGVSRLPQD